MNRPLRVAVIGAGPAGIYAADHLIKASETVTVDIFDKLPTPYGLIRYGVAPDHPGSRRSSTPSSGSWTTPASGSSATSPTAST
ncbi:FAD/NAD(P)-binding protein [Actinoplanes sp. CA-252034]|uniref:FAD/NAD(P)-binding protein n=1 Tax=Actinoplanes sp. CA-252034 TaxID=3239906 RepID=UPI003D9656B3